MTGQQEFIKDFGEQELCPEIYQPSLFLERSINQNRAISEIEWNGWISSQ